MLTGQQMRLLQIVMDRFDHLFIGGCGGRRGDMCNEMRTVLITDFSQMHFVSHERLVLRFLL